MFNVSSRLIIWPMFSVSIAKWSFFSIPSLTIGLIKTWAELGVPMLIPVASTHKEMVDMIGKHDSIDFVPIETSQIGNGFVYYKDVSNFRKRADWKVVLNINVEVTSQVRSLLFKSFPRFSPTIINYVMFSLGEPFSKEDRFLIGSNIVSAPSIFSSEFNQSEASRFLSTFFTGSIVSNWKKTFVNLGIDISRLEEHKPSRVGDGVTRFIYGGRLASHKHFEIGLRVISRIVSSGSSAEYIVHTYSKSYCGMLSDMAKTNSFIRPFYDQPKAKYYENLSRADIFLCCSTAESYGLAVYEALYLGVIVVFMRADWISAVLPKHYPFIVDSEEEMVQCSSWIMRNLNEAREKILPYIEWIRDNHDKKKQDISLLDTVQKLGGVYE